MKTSSAVLRLMSQITRGDGIQGNPYANDLVSAVLKEIAAERNRKSWLDALEGLPEYVETKMAGETWKEYNERLYGKETQ